MKTFKIVSVSVFCSMLCSCSNSLKLGGLKYRTTGRQYVDDLGHVVMIERKGRNHVRAIAPLKLAAGSFQANSKQVYQESSFGIGGALNFNSVTVGKVGIRGEVGKDKDKDLNYYSESKGSYVIFFCSHLEKFTNEINSPENLQTRKWLYEMQSDPGSPLYRRAFGIVSHAVKVFDHEELQKLGVAATGEGGPRVTELLGETTADGAFKVVSNGITRLENGSVAAYLVSRLYFTRDAVENGYLISTPSIVDYVGTDVNPFLNPFYWVKGAPTYTR